MAYRKPGRDAKNDGVIRRIIPADARRRRKKKDGDVDEDAGPDWNTLIQAGAECGLSESDFWFCTPRYFAALQRAKNERYKEDYERARYLGYLTLLPHVEKGKDLKPIDLGRFPWETEQRGEFLGWEGVDPEMLAKFNTDADGIALKMQNNG